MCVSTLSISHTLNLSMNSIDLYVVITTAIIFVVIHNVYTSIPGDKIVG